MCVLAHAKAAAVPPVVKAIAPTISVSRQREGDLTAAGARTAEDIAAAGA
jgi:hypothetical protein